MRLKRWSVGRLVAILDGVMAFPESTGWPCPRDGDHADLYEPWTNQAPTAAAMEAPPKRDGNATPEAGPNGRADSGPFTRGRR